MFDRVQRRGLQSLLEVGRYFFYPRAIGGVEFMTGLRRAAPGQALSKTPKMEPAVGELPNGGAGRLGVEVGCIVICDACGCTTQISKYTESAVSISRTARQADKDPLRINDAIILNLFPPFAVRSTNLGDIFSMSRFLM